MADKTIERDKSKIFMKQDKKTLGTIIRWVTGHNFLDRHQNLLFLARGIYVEYSPLMAKPIIDGWIPIPQGGG